MTENKKVCKLQELRQEGWRIRIRHARAFKGFSQLMTRGQYEELVKDQPTNILVPSFAYKDMVLAKKGHCTVMLTHEDGRELIGEAECSPAENYNRKRALGISLGRALNGKK